MELKEILTQTKGVFKPPIKRYYLGRVRFGCPYFTPWNFNQTILTIRKERPQFLRCKHFKLFGYEISYGWPVAVVKYGLGWKTKYDSVRHEWSPSFQIYFFFWQFCIWWTAPRAKGDDEDYWEMMLWWLKYSDKDIKKAEETWGWVDGITKESTWNKDYLV